MKNENEKILALLEKQERKIVVIASETLNIADELNELIREGWMLRGNFMGYYALELAPQK